MTADALQERIAEALVDAAHDQYPEGMRPGDNEDCGCPWGIGEIDWLGFADAVLAVLADADPTDLGMETSGVWYCRRHAGTANEDDHRGLCPWWDHADHCDAEHDEGLDDGACSPCQWVELLIPPAHPRTKEADHG